MAYKDFKVLPRRTAADKLLCDKASNTAEYPKYDGYHRGLASMVYKSFEKKTSGGANEIMTNQQLAEELHKPIFFLRKDFACTRTLTNKKPTNKTKISEQKNNKGDNFLRAQTPKGIKVAYFTFGAFFTIKIFS